MTNLLRITSLPLRIMATCAVLLLTATVSSQDDATPRHDADAAELRALTFNIRYGSANDGRNSWPLRAELVAATIRRNAPHVLGVQEALDFQIQYLREQLPGYGCVGQGRDGGTRGEYSAVMYDRERLELLRTSDFWLSPQPDVVASVGWDAALTRMVTWAVFRDRSTDTCFTVWNTHFDHRGREARSESGRLIAAHVARSPLPDVVMGDLNAGEDSAALGHLRDAGLRDTFRERHPDAEAAGTFGGWRGLTNGAKIDYVLVDAGFITVAAEIDTWNQDGRYPSDHYPVAATLRFAQPGPAPLRPVLDFDTEVVVTADTGGLLLNAHPELASDALELGRATLWHDGDRWRAAAALHRTRVGSVLVGWDGGPDLRRPFWRPAGIVLRAARIRGESLAADDGERLGAPAHLAMGGERWLVYGTGATAAAEPTAGIGLLRIGAGGVVRRALDHRGFSRLLELPGRISALTVLATGDATAELLILAERDGVRTLHRSRLTFDAEQGRPIAAQPNLLRSDLQDGRALAVCRRAGAIHLFLPAGPGRTDLHRATDVADFAATTAIGTLADTVTDVIDDRIGGDWAVVPQAGGRLALRTLHWELEVSGTTRDR